MYDFNLVLLLLQQMCVFLVIAWLMSKTPLFIPLMQVTVRLPHKFLCYIVFSIFCIMGTWFGLHIDDSIANTRAIGAVMGGLLGGPVVGGLVGLTGGLHRYSMGGMTALSCMISTIVEGLLGGLVHSILIRRSGSRARRSTRAGLPRRPRRQDRSRPAEACSGVSWSRCPPNRLPWNRN